MTAVAGLFSAYVIWLGIDLSYQDFAEESASLPGKYGPPEGEILLAHGVAGDPLGCVALRPLETGTCEMKRLYVTPGARGLGLGRALALAVIAQGRDRGYRRMVLDTVPQLAAAIALYADLGFQPIAAYYETPVADTVFLALDL